MVAVASRIRLEDRECPLSTTVEHVGEWWTLLILHDAFDGYTRFDFDYLTKQLEWKRGESTDFYTTLTDFVLPPGY